MLLCACPYAVKSEISLDTGDSAYNAVVKRSVFINQRCAECMFVLWTSCLRAKVHCYYMWPFAKKLYHSWISMITSSNEISWKFPPPKWRAGCAPDICNGAHTILRSSILSFFEIFCLIEMLYWALACTKLNILPIDKMKISILYLRMFSQRYWAIEKINFGWTH